MTESQDPEGVLRDLKAGNVPAGELYASIHALGHSGPIRESKATVEDFLEHEDPQLRYIALNVLTIHWRCVEHRNTCERFARADTDSDNRRMGVSGIGALLEGTRDRAALILLLEYFSNESEEHDLRHAAYCSILYVLGAPIQEQPRRIRNFDLKNDVNQGRLAEAEQIAAGN